MLIKRSIYQSIYPSVYDVNHCELKQYKSSIIHKTLTWKYTKSQCRL